MYEEDNQSPYLDRRYLNVVHWVRVQGTRYITCISQAEIVLHVLTKVPRRTKPWSLWFEAESFHFPRQEKKDVHCTTYNLHICHTRAPTSWAGT